LRKILELLEHPEAALAHLTLLLIGVARISIDIGHDLPLRMGPLLASVFEFIEEHYHEPISLATIAERPMRAGCCVKPNLPAEAIATSRSPLPRPDGIGPGRRCQPGR
jgi:hypothetical protein